MLVDYMSTHPSFANGEFTGPLGSQQYLQQWETLRMLLREHGPDKSIEQWRHTWRDLKKKARGEGASLRKALTATGNLIPVPSLSETTNKILGVIGTEMAFGIGGDSQETGIGELPSHKTVESSMGQSQELNNEIEIEIIENQGQALGYAVPSIVRQIEMPVFNEEQRRVRAQSPTNPTSTSTQSQIQMPVFNLEHRQAPGQSPMLPAYTSTFTRSQNTAHRDVHPTTSTSQQRRIGLGDRAVEFLAAEQATTNVLKDIVNTIQTQNQLLKERNNNLVLQNRLKNRER
ncbi:uncharacterized protein LOC126380941 [Pectinophora gossypiella]|nr:uncharacterized protein LOC126380941 [Pectinophora gossypiella]